MKHLISLSLKYIRRQKLRTTLTVLCIVLAVFILNVFAVAGSSLLATLRESEIRNNGAWEVDLGGFVTKPEITGGRTAEEMEQLVREHAAVSEYLFTHSGMLSTASQVRNPSNAISFVELQVGEGAPQRISSLRFYQAEGSSALTSSNGPRSASIATTLKENEVFLPGWMESQGCKVGDTVTLRGTVVYAVLDESVPQVQEILKIMEEKNAGPGGHYYMIGDGSERGTEPPQEIIEAGRPVHQTNLMTLLMHLLGEYTLQDIDFRETLRSDAVEITVTIAGFYDEYAGGDSRTSADILMPWGCADFAEKLYMSAESLLAKWEEDYLAASENGDFYGAGTEMLQYHAATERYASISEKIPFTDGLTMLLTSAGVEDPELTDYYFPAGQLNGTLLMTKLRYMNAATDIMLLFGAFAVLLIIIWAFARFVIDNAFEISVQERSVQFAALRLMGASKRQLLAVVFTEATVYTLICVPLGLGAALGLTALILQVLRNAGMSTVVFEVQPLLQCVTAFLAVIAIYISAYTSAIYASRKLTLTETMQFGKPQMPKKNKQVRSKLNVSAQGFIYRYGWKNIMRTKRRFLISSIALVLGVTLSAFCSYAAIRVGGEIAWAMTADEAYRPSDFEIHGSGTAAYEVLNTYLKGNPDYEAYEITAGDWYDMDEETSEKLDALPMIEAAGFSWVAVVDQDVYDRDLADFTGVSYETWVDSQQAFLTQSPYPYGNVDENSNPIEPLPAKYASAAEVFGDLEPVVTMTEGRQPVPIMGVMVLPEAVFERYMRWSGSGLLLPIENYYRYFDYLGVTASLDATQQAKYGDLLASVTQMTQENGLEMYDAYAGATGLVKILIALLAAMVIFLGSIWLAGVFSMVNTLHTNVLNRRSELRMLRAVGCSIKQMKKMLVMEGMLFSSVSTAIGIGLGALLAYAADGGAKGADTVSIGIYIVIYTAALFGINLLISVLCAKPGLKTLKNEIR